ncbi:MAG: hypothetical protein HND48_15930 [Chloroflexi bacterium]|nr:hypothetical protein [Chloroflexota bacterium]
MSTGCASRPWPVSPDALITTGFPTTKATDPDNNLAEVTAALPQIADLRRSGSAAFDLAQAASGRVEAFWEYGLSAWGCRRRHPLGRGSRRPDQRRARRRAPKKTGLLASNGHIHDVLHALIRRAYVP